MHKEIYYLLGKSVIAKLKGDREEGSRLQEAAIKLAWDKEEEIQAVLDCLYLGFTVTEKMTMEGVTEFKTV